MVTIVALSMEAPVLSAAMSDIGTYKRSAPCKTHC